MGFKFHEIGVLHASALLKYFARNDELSEMFMAQIAVYILSNKYRNVIYTGVTSNLIQRTSQHKERAYSSFSKRYNCDLLVYYEVFEDMEKAIAREKQIKAGSRKKKEDLIKSENTEWNDLFYEITK